MLLTVPQAAEKLQLSRQRVHKLVVEGRIEAQRIGRDYMIEHVELRRFQRKHTSAANKPKGGRPRHSTRQFCGQCGASITSTDKQLGACTQCHAKL